MEHDWVLDLKPCIYKYWPYLIIDESDLCTECRGPCQCLDDPWFWEKRPVKVKSINMFWR